MNKKEFETIAAVIRDRKENGAHLHHFGWTWREMEAAKATIDDLQVFMAEKLRATYPKTFHYDKFMQACEIESEEQYHDDVKVRIRFVDDGTEQTVFIRQSHDTGDDDDGIFFYGMSRQSIVDAAKSGEVIENEWVITEVL